MTTNEIGHRPIPEQPGLDGAKGVQAESNSYTAKVPCCQELLLSGFTSYSETLLSSAWDFFGVTLAREESA